MLSSTVSESQRFADQVRLDAIEQIYRAGSGHPGGALSCADILAVLFCDILDLKSLPADRLILSKGQSCPALYAAWVQAGLMDAEELQGFRKLGRKLQGLPHVFETSLAETSTGSLGQGFSVSVGLAMGYRHQKIPQRVFAILGDGELQAGIVWEAAMCAGHYKLNHLTAIIDYNKLQSDAPNKDIMGLEPLADKWRAFNWDVETIDGHDHQALNASLETVSNGKPRVIIANTVKGKGISWMENVPAWHGSVKLSDREYELAMQELGASA